MPKNDSHDPNARGTPSNKTWMFGGIGVAAVVLLVGYVVSRPPAQTKDEHIDNRAAKEQADGKNPSADIALMPETEQAKQRATQLLHGVGAPIDTWPTEAFSELATSKLKQLAELAPYADTTYEETRFIVADDLVFDALRPQRLQSVYETSRVEVRRLAGRPAAQAIALSQGTHGFANTLRDLFSSITSDSRAAFKILRVQQTATGFDTVIHAEGGGKTDQGRKQWTATWNCNWSDDAQLLTSISVADYEEVLSQGQEPWLVDATNSILGQADGYREQLLYGMDYWVNKLEHRFYVNRLGHHGTAIADINNDGLEDLYVCQPGGLPNRLYVHQADGTAKDYSAQAEVNFLDDTTSALLVDLDNDGDQDLAILTVSGGFVFANNGKGNFTMHATMPDCRNAFSITAADYDRDGLLDLYIGRYWPKESVRGAIPLPVPYYDATNGGSNVLLKNDGELKFTDVTEAMGLSADNSRYTMAVAWEDYDNDGDQDLYVANDFGRNCLYRNDDGTFVNVALETGVEDTAAGMSVSWADFNHDGNMDVYVGNMFSSAGGRITYQRQFEDLFDVAARSKLQRLARGNSLFSNIGGHFNDVSLPSAVTMGRWAWGSMFVDLNNDSWDDLVVANGHVTTDDTGDL